MATLTGNAINTSYQGLIKFDDNGTINPTVLKQLTDGTGGTLPIQISQVETKFQSLVDFTSATVTGLATGGGLVSGTGTNSLQSGIAGATGNASSTNSIAIGVDASMSGGFGAAIGIYSEAGGNYANAFGSLCNASATNSLAVGKQATASGIASISIGNESSVTLQGQIAIGSLASCGNIVANAIAIGNNASAGGGTVVGNGAQGFSAGRSAAYGAGAQSLSNESVAIGGDAVVASNSTGGIAIGDSATVATSSPNAVAIGNDVTASTDNTVTIKRLQMLDYATLNYADDAAAATGNIPLGGVYHTDGALKIRIA